MLVDRIAGLWLDDDMSNHDPSWDYDYEDELAAAMAAEDAERQRDYEAAERLRRNR